MVHNLRSRNVCGTSEKVGDTRRRIMNTPVAQRPHPPAIRLENHSTPLVTTPSESLLGEVAKCSHQVQQTTMEQISTPRRPKSSFLTSTRIDNAPARKDNSNLTLLSESEHNAENASIKKSNLSSYDLNIFSAVDEAIFSKTYRSTKGLSIHGVRKFIEDLGYNPKKCANKVRLYVRDCLAKNKLVQVTGKGANGSFRLNKSLHSTFIKAHKNGKIYKRRNVSSSAVYRKRLMLHDMVMRRNFETS